MTNVRQSLVSRFFFRLRFDIPEHKCFGSEVGSVEIPTDGDDVTLHLSCVDGSGTIESARRLVLSGGPYRTESEAHLAAKRTQITLMRHSLRYRIGIALHSERPGAILYEGARQMIAEQTGCEIFQDSLGVRIYDGTRKIEFVDLRASTLHSLSAGKLFETFMLHTGSDCLISSRQELAFELFSASQFENGLRSRFLTLIMAIESLIEPIQRSKAAVSLIDSMIERLKNTNLKPSEVASLRGGLTRLRDESIVQSGRRLANRLLSEKSFDEKSPGDFFAHCYRLRSRLVHEGAIVDKKRPLARVIGTLERFVSELILDSLDRGDA